MSGHASLSARSNPVVFIALLTAALTSAVVVAAALSGAGSGSALDLWRAAGYGVGYGLGQSSALATEQRRQAQALEVIELSVGQIRTDVALLTVRVSEAETLYRDWVNAVPAKAAQINPAQTSPAPINPAPVNPTQVVPAQSMGPAFELDALRTSFDGTIDERADARRHNAQLARRWRAQHAARGAATAARTAPSV
jgi:hypothetical protein